MAHIWELFRNIDADKQQRVLRKWEEHLAAQRHDMQPRQPASPALRALQVRSRWGKPGASSARFRHAGRGFRRSLTAANKVCCDMNGLLWWAYDGRSYHCRVSDELPPALWLSIGPVKDVTCRRGLAPRGGRARRSKRLTRNWWTRWRTAC